MTNAYMMGFSKTAEAYGVDPKALVKFAEESDGIMDSAAKGGKIGLGVGGGVGAVTGAGLGYSALHGLRKDMGFLKGVKPDKAIMLNPEYGAQLARTFRKMNKSKLYSALTKAKWTAVPAAILGTIGAASGGIDGSIIGAIVGAIKKGKKNKKD